MALNSQARRQVTPATGASSQAVCRQASPADSTLSQAASTVSQAFPADRALSQAESAVSQVFPADSTLFQAESTVSQEGIPQAALVVRHSTRLRALHASQSSYSQAGNTPWKTVLPLSQIEKPPTWALPRLVFTRQLAVLVPRKQGLPPFPIGITVPMFLPQGRNLTQSGSSTYLANL